MRCVIVAGLLLAAAVGVTSAKPTAGQLDGYTFDQYSKDFSRNYGPEERVHRRGIFETNLRKIQKHNAEGHSWKMGVNHLTDQSDKEFQRRLGGRATRSGVPDAKLPNLRRQAKRVGGAVPLPTAVDWRTHVPQVISAVKDQGQCGSCWAHGATENIESMVAIQTGNLFVLSQQQITACAMNPNHCGGTGGCEGSIAELAYEYVIDQKGIAEEWTYPYTAYSGTTGNCSATLPPAIATISSYNKLPSNDQGAVMEHLAGVGTLAVNVMAINWHHYESGVYDGCAFNQNIDIDHVVQLVGYGTDAGLGKDYWIVRNSWNANFGEAGYIRLERTASPSCGTDTTPADGTACMPYPASQHVCGQCGILFDTSFPSV